MMTTTKFLIWFFAIALTFSFTACENGEGNEADRDDTDTLSGQDTLDDENMNGTVTLNEFRDFYQEYSDVSIELENGDNTLEPGSQTLNFNIQNFELGDQTPDYEQTGLAFSEDGQHIHVIIDNDPYMAKYEPKVDVEISDENMVILAFPARSYHLSLKDAHVLKKLNTTGAENFDENAPHLFYSRPKGNYGNPYTDKVLLDFYLVNVDLSDDGYYVMATVDDNQEFKITEWKPYILEGFSMGKHTIKLELFDGEGNSVDSPLNPVTREIELTETQTAMSM